jgi:hypothetical protein
MNTNIMEVRVYAIGLAYASACAPSDMEREEVERQVNAQHPSGVRPWRIAEESFRTGEANPHPCQDKPDHLHYLLSC